MRFSHLLQAISDLSFCGLIKILKLITNHFIFRISRQIISILLNIYANRLKVLKSWSEIKTEFNLEEELFYKWFQLLHVIPNQWKRIIKITNDSCINIVYFEHHLVKNNRIVAMEKLYSKEIYSLIISQNMGTPTSQQCFKTLFLHLNLDWKLIYLLPRTLTKSTFQYKVLNNELYLNHKLFQFTVSTTSLCSYCNQHDETAQHLFSTCNQAISLWTEIKLCFVNDIKIIALCPQAIAGFTNTDGRCFITHLLRFTYIREETVEI